jgi:hypothetical protein
VINVTQRFVDQGGHVAVEEAIDDVTAVAIPDDQTEIPQHAQLMGDSRLLHLHCRTEVTDCAWLFSEASQYAHPAGGGEGAHEPGHLLCRRLAQWPIGPGVVGVTHVDMFTCTYVHVNAAESVGLISDLFVAHSP